MAEAAAIKGTGGRRRLRCAIYTRKSTEEGLEQDFNSLDAQREASEAYILSQKHEGWTAVRTCYDDGGFSGGTMQRPALRRLLSDVQDGRVDVVVVYKVDRLTRSLADFAKIVEVLDAKEVSFVSVTQQFNTTTSMGRLTLNVLLSFAQFEREIAGERIRDKIAASKRKGLWMGGPPPIGYDNVEKKLIVNRNEAKTVRAIFTRYGELGSVRALKHDLDDRGVVGKLRVDRHGRRTGGKPFARGGLYRMLQNRTYLGEVVHQGKSYPGQHEAIIDQALWDKVQQRLGENRIERGQGGGAQFPSLLVGLLHDDSGEAMTPSHAVKQGRRYRYYVSRSLTRTSRSDAPEGRRIPAGEIEPLVVDRLKDFLVDEAAMFECLAAGLSDITRQRRLIDGAARLAGNWPKLSLSERRAIVRGLVHRVEVRRERIDVHVVPQRLTRMLNGEARLEDLPFGREEKVEPVVLSIAARLKRVGIEMKMVVDSASAENERARINPGLIKLLVKAHLVKERLIGAGDASLTQIARDEGVSRPYLSCLVRLAFLAPDITAAILDGRQLQDLTAKRLMNVARLPCDWEGQRAVLGFS